MTNGDDLLYGTNSDNQPVLNENILGTYFIPKNEEEYIKAVQFYRDNGASETNNSLINLLNKFGYDIKMKTIACHHNTFIDLNPKSKWSCVGYNQIIYTEESGFVKTDKVWTKLESKNAF